MAGLALDLAYARFEMTSSIPNRRYGDGLRRLGFGGETTLFFDEHVEADAVREHRRRRRRRRARHW